MASVISLTSFTQQSTCTHWALTVAELQLNNLTEKWPPLSPRIRIRFAILTNHLIRCEGKRPFLFYYYCYCLYIMTKCARNARENCMNGILYEMKWMNELKTWNFIHFIHLFSAFCHKRTENKKFFYFDLYFIAFIEGDTTISF